MKMLLRRYTICFFLQQERYFYTLRENSAAYEAINILNVLYAKIPPLWSDKHFECSDLISILKALYKHKKNYYGNLMNSER